jgi:hypothetical protein
MSAWILLALLAPAAYAGANLVDAAFARKWSKDPLGLSIASGIMNGAFLPLTLWIDPPRWPGGHWPLLAAIGILECAYLFPYYRALQEDDTSNIASLFELGKVLTPLAAFLISREVAAPTQYLGFALIVGASAALTLDVRAAGVRLRGSFGLMLLAAGCLAVQAGLYKLALDAMGWGTAFAWATALSSAFALGTLLHPRLRRRTTDALAAVRRHASPFLAGEILTFAGTAASSAAPATARCASKTRTTRSAHAVRAGTSTSPRPTSALCCAITASRSSSSKPARRRRPRVPTNRSPARC